MVRLSLFLQLLGCLALSGCGGRDDGALKVAFAESPADMFATGNRLSAGAQHLRAATAAGLVALDEQGEVVPALADRWIVTDDGRSFIFRLREGDWPDGSELSGESVRRALRDAIVELRGTSLGLDLARIEEVRAMAGRVVEIRLSSPLPMLLQLLAQPELALARGRSAPGPGPMLLQRSGDLAVLTMKPPAERGLPEEEDWAQHFRAIELRPLPAQSAVDGFGNDAFDVVLGGRLATLPLADTGPLSRGTVRLDPAVGLFGLHVRRAQGFLATAAGREAIAMVLDRAALIAPFNIGGWVPTTRLVAPGLPEDPGLIAERWADQPLEDVRAAAAQRVGAWRGANGGQAPTLTLAIARAPGTDLLFRELSSQLAAIGIVLRRVPEDARADLVLVDRVARYAAPGWFLNQFHCSLRQGMCDSKADAMVAEAHAEPEPVARATQLARAEAQLTLSNVFIPFGSPLRWSLVRSDVTGFAPNAWAFHPLPAMAVIPR